MEPSEVLRPDPAALKRLATLDWQARRFADAAGRLEQVSQLEPENPHILNSLGLCLIAMGRETEALLKFEAAVSKDPDSEAFQTNFGMASAKASRWPIARSAFQKVLGINPSSQPALSGLAEACSNLGFFEEQSDALERLANLRPLNLPEALFRAEALMRIGDLVEAQAQLDSVLERQPQNATAHFLQGSLRQLAGSHELATRDFELAIDLNPNLAPSYWYLTQSKKFRESDRPLISRIEERAQAADMPLIGRGILDLALASAYNDLAVYEEAMAAMDRANAVFKHLRGHPFERELYRQFIDDLMATFGPDDLRKPIEPVEPNDRPIFVVGMPRSGTTLTETILARHPSVSPGGEISFWTVEAPNFIDFRKRQIAVQAATQARERYRDRLRALSNGRPRVTDKLPSNYLYVGLLSRLFPDARFVLCRRHPVDNLISFYMTNFNQPPPFSFDKSDLVFAYREHARLCRYWRENLSADRWFQVRYEELVADQETVVRKLLAFCDLDWDEACLHPEGSDRVIQTMSHRQARQPIYTTSKERWRHYEPWLGAFRDLIEDPPEF